MAPPTKRRKRNVVHSSSESDGDEPPAKPQALGTMNSPDSSSPDARPTRKMNATKPPASSQMSNVAGIQPAKQRRGSKPAPKSATASPDKPKRKGKMEDKVKSGDIFTFFTKQAQRQQAEGGGNNAAVKPKLSSQPPKDPNVEDNDLISDDDEYDGMGKPPPSSIVVQAARKRTRGSNTFKSGDEPAPSASQKFLMKPKEKAGAEEDMRPWAERFAPTNLEELAVHKRKVNDVRTWLEDVMAGRMRQRLLILKGAAGTGKTTTVQLLAKSMYCDILEWRNPVGSVATSDGYQSMAAQFEEFMGRGGKFGQLDIFSENGKLPTISEIKPLDRRKQVILVEEFPNTFTRSSVALQSFRSALVEYLVSNTPPLSTAFSSKVSSEPITPVVMVISEALLTTTSASADSFTAYRLLGPEILQHPGVGIIEFNAIAPTFIAKGLEIIVQKESRKSGRKKTPGPQVLKSLGEIGDIRSAIGSLEFMCLRGDLDDWGSKVAFGKAKKASKDTALTRMEEESLELITRREASLGIFHAVGKVVYNKREEKILDSVRDVEGLPEHISLCARPRRSEVMVDQLIDETGTDTQTFIAALHENYLLSCDAPPASFDHSSLDHVNGCIDALSDSDLLCPSWDGSIGFSGFGGGSGGQESGGNIMRQDEITFQIAVRGILFSLPHPVKRKAFPQSGSRPGKRGDEFKMFYPTGLRLWRMREEIQSTIDLWVTRLIKGDDHMSNVTAGAAAYARPKAGTVESWKNSTQPPPSKKSTLEEEATPLLAIGASARKEMLLERLPYMVRIAKARKNGNSMLAIRDMEKVTAFHGIGGPSDDNEDEGEDATGEEWATDKPGEGGKMGERGKRLVIRGRGDGSVIPLPVQVEQKLELSDDEIEG